jgi:hypothetical protein
MEFALPEKHAKESDSQQGHPGVLKRTARKFGKNKVNNLVMK